MSREETKIGDRVRLIPSDNKFTLLKPGDLGTVWDITICSMIILMCNILWKNLDR